MTEVYFYPNEVEIVVIDGIRRAYLKHDWKEIRKKNEPLTTDDALCIIEQQLMR